MLAIRLSRVGTKHVPFFRIIVVDSRKKRDGAYKENLGTYDARKTSLVQFKPERYEHWVKEGAQPSDTVQKIYRMFKRNAVASDVAPKVAQKAPVAKKAAEPVKKEAPKKEVESKAVESTDTEDTK